MRRWKITVEAWPFSTGQGNVVDQKNAGPRSADYYVEARDATDALRLAQAIQQGVKASPHVWEAPITALVQLPHGSALPANNAEVPYDETPRSD